MGWDGAVVLGSRRQTPDYDSITTPQHPPTPLHTHPPTHTPPTGPRPEGAPRAAAAPGHHDLRRHPRPHPAPAGRIPLLWGGEGAGHAHQAGAETKVYRCIPPTHPTHAHLHPAPAGGVSVLWGPTTTRFSSSRRCGDKKKGVARPPPPHASVHAHARARAHTHHIVSPLVLSRAGEGGVPVRQ